MAPVSGNIESSSLACPRCGHHIYVNLVRRKWLLGGWSAKPITCDGCGARCYPDLKLEWARSLILIVIFGFMFIQLKDQFGQFTVSVVIIASLPVVFAYRWFSMENQKVVCEKAPDDLDPIPETMSPQITENDDGTFSVKGKTYKSWKSAEAYLDLVGRMQKVN